MHLTICLIKSSVSFPQIGEDRRSKPACLQRMRACLSHRTLNPDVYNSSKSPSSIRARTAPSQGGPLIITTDSWAIWQDGAKTDRCTGGHGTAVRPFHEANE